MERFGGPEVAAGILDAVVVEVAGAALEDGGGKGVETVLLRQRAGGHLQQRIDADAVPVGVDGDGGEPELREGPAEAQDMFDPHRLVAVARDHRRERRQVADLGPRLRNREDEGHLLGAGARRPVLLADLKALIGWRAVVGVEEARRYKRSGDEVVDVPEAVEERLAGEGVSADEQVANLGVGEQRAEASRRGRRRGAVVDGQDEVAGLRGRCVGGRPGAALLQHGHAGGVLRRGGDVPHAIRGRERPQRSVAVQSAADQLEVARGRLGGEGPGVGHVFQLAGPRQVREQRLQLGGLRAVVDARVRRDDRLAVGAAHLVGQHHRVLVLLRERHHRAQDERAGGPFVKGQEVVGLRAQRVVRQLRVEEVCRRAGHRKEQVESAGVRVVEEVLPRIVERVGEVPAVEVQRRGGSGREIHEVDAVVPGVGVVLAVVEVEDVEVPVERHRDGRKGPEAVEGVEQAAQVALELRRRDERGVDAQPGGAGRVGPGGEVVGEGDLGQRRVREIERDPRPARLLRWRKAFERRALPASAQGKAKAKSHREGAKDAKIREGWFL